LEILGINLIICCSDKLIKKYELFWLLKSSIININRNTQSQENIKKILQKNFPFFLNS